MIRQMNNPITVLRLQSSLDWLDNELGKMLQHEPSQLRLFVVHHHPIQYSEPYPDIPAFVDFSILSNAGNLHALLRKHNFDILIHGHRHVPKFESHTILFRLSDSTYWVPEASA